MENFIVKPTVYVETSVISYLTARPSSDSIREGQRKTTIEWWSNRSRYDLFVSDAVLNEAECGDPAAAADRMAALQGIPVLPISDEAQDLADALIRSSVVPEKAVVDALHIAIATVNGIDLLMTWNCRHIANAVIRPRIEAFCRTSGFEPPSLCTPHELCSFDEEDQ